VFALHLKLPSKPSAPAAVTADSNIDAWITRLANSSLRPRRVVLSGQDYPEVFTAPQLAAFWQGVEQ
jgi:hypothetical protein